MLDIETSPVSTSTTGLARTVIAAGLTVTLCLGILAFGSTQRWSIFAFEAAMGILFAATWTRMTIASDFQALRNPILVPILLFGVVIAVQLFAVTSAYPSQTRAEAVRYAAYLCVFIVASDSLRRRETRRAFLAALIVFGALVS